MLKKITSSQNPYIKSLLKLKEKSRERNQTKLFLIEGKRELSLAIKGGFNIKTLLFYPDLFSETEAKSFLHYGVEVIEVSKEVFQKLAHRDGTEGVLALAECKMHKLSDLNLSKANPLILVAEAPEKPGNIGALLRTADAANVDAVIIANPKTDLYNPNIIRSSVGCVFTNQIATGTTHEVISFLKDHNIAIYCASLQSAKNYTEIDLTHPTAIVVGTEDAGLSAEWTNSATQNIIIPMQGTIDSMNVSVAAGILLFEAKRQRKFL
ncbi:RNA methyltransferase [Paucihalobacter ruber]|uniref:RNA methyltransferase n=1 Tax=Paucihalobacter ruber TaxID=2567861 RepID=A0A506PGX9_9FLAO|nr:RNA methyltransferase [Paucihalobacter ruber]TPV32879.1 RNA methyltransferase [Paucihalobacter ruber]